MTAANVSDELMSFYPYDHEVKVIEQAGAVDEKIYTAPLHELSAAVGEEVNNLRALYISPLKDGLSFNIKDYTKDFDEYDDITEADLVDKLEKLVAGLKANLDREEDYTSDNSKLLAGIIHTSLDFTIASDNYYELSDILSEMKADREK